MKRGPIRAKCFYLIYSLALILAACNPTGASKTPTPTLFPSQTQPTENITPTIEATLPPLTTSTPTFFSSAPQDDTIDATCRITINFFFSYKQGDDLQAFRDLFTSLSHADSYRPPAEALILLDLMLASQWWQQDYPGTPMPDAVLPQHPNEFVYYVKYTGYYAPNVTPAYWFPDFMTMTMVVDDPYSCKIKGYGKG